MGYISELAQSKNKAFSTLNSPHILRGVTESPRNVRQAVELGRSNWREVFATNKEDSNTQERREVSPGGSWARSALSSDASTKRLIEAMRSRAPG